MAWLSSARVEELPLPQTPPGSSARLPELRLPPWPCRESSNAGCVGTTAGRFRITHPFHPLRGAEYELVTRKLTWGEDRVFYYDPDGKLKSLLTNVTDVVSIDAFDRISAGRSAFRVDDLLELRRLFDKRKSPGKAHRMCKVNIAAYDRRILPHRSGGRARLA